MADQLAHFSENCNRPSVIFAPGFREKKTSPSRQIFHHVFPFCQVAVLHFQTHKNDICRVCDWVAPGKPQTGRVKKEISPRTKEAKFSVGEGKNPLGRVSPALLQRGVLAI